jgi:hypothetical protein
MPNLLARFLDAAFILGVIGIVAKASELILDSSEQLRVQRSLDRVTLRLIDWNILKWYPRLREYKINLPIFTAIVLMEIVLMTQPRARRPIGWSSYLLIFAIQWPIYLAYVCVLAKSKNRLVFCILAILPILVGIGFAFIAFGALLVWVSLLRDLSHSNPSHINLEYVLNAFYLLLPALLIGAVLLLLTLLLTLLGSAVTGLHVAIELLRAMMWRIVTYGKGAWAALWLLATVALGVFELAMRTK